MAENKKETSTQARALTGVWTKQEKRSHAFSEMRRLRKQTAQMLKNARYAR
jgi:hypothetical protein